MRAPTSYTRSHWPGSTASSGRVVVTPGDNDWTDCWGRYGPGTGGFDPEERLNYERKLFFGTDQSLGAAHDHRTAREQ